MIEFRVPRSLSIVSSIPKSVAKSTLLQHQQEHLDTSRPTGEEVTCICMVTKGFFCLIGGKRLCLYTKIGDSWDFAKTREYVVPSSETSTTRSSITTYLAPSQVSTDQQPLSTNQMMWKVAVSPKEEHVLVLSNKQQLYSVSDMTKDQTVESRVSRRMSLRRIHIALSSISVGSVSVGTSFSFFSSIEHSWFGYRHSETTFHLVG